mmetsp:Transcript_34593/g.61850  ORF Transcript_34593/g.61850 Transcript_34593/m.61850 type:complete len:212 (-) Transcript_34593:899-1534(-)
MREAVFSLDSSSPRRGWGGGLRGLDRRPSGDNGAEAAAAESPSQSSGQGPNSWQQRLPGSASSSASRSPGASDDVSEEVSERACEARRCRAASALALKISYSSGVMFSVFPIARDQTDDRTDSGTPCIHSFWIFLVWYIVSQFGMTSASHVSWALRMNCSFCCTSARRMVSFSSAFFSRFFWSRRMSSIALACSRASFSVLGGNPKGRNEC